MKIINNILLVPFFFSATAGIFADQEMFTGFDQAGVDFVEGMENLTIQFMSSTVEKQGNKLSIDGELQNNQTVKEEVLTENTMQDPVAIGQQVLGTFNSTEKSLIFSNSHSQYSSFEENDTSEGALEEVVVSEQKKQNNKPSLFNSNSASVLIGIGMVIQAIIILNKIFLQGERGNNLHCQC